MIVVSSESARCSVGAIAPLLATGCLRVPEGRRRRVALPARAELHVDAATVDSPTHAGPVGAKGRT